MAGRYLIGIDGGAAGENALRWALRRAERRPAPVLLVHIADPSAQATEGAWMLEGTLERAQAQHPGLHIAAERVQGHLPGALTELATPEDLLVIGTHQHAFPRTPVEVCHSWDIASASSSSVAVVPEVDVHLRSGVVVGIDHHESGARLAEIAAVEAETLGQELIVVQAVPESRAARRGGLALEDAVRAARATVATPISSMLIHQSPALALAHVAHTHALLVIGESTGAAESGSTLREVLTSIPVPVLLVRGIVGAAPRMSEGLRESVLVG